MARGRLIISSGKYAVEEEIERRTKRRRVAP